MIIRDLSLLQVAEFLAEPQYLPVSTFLRNFVEFGNGWRLVLFSSLNPVCKAGKAANCHKSTDYFQ